MQPYRIIVAFFTQELDYPLAFAQAINAYKVRPVGFQAQGCQQSLNFLLRYFMTEYRKCEGRFGDENIAVYGLECFARRVWAALIVSRNSNATSLILEYDLGGSQYVARGHEFQVETIDTVCFAVCDRFEPADGIGTVAEAHDRCGFARCQNSVMACTGVIGVTMGDDGARSGEMGIDEEIAGFAIQTRVRWIKPTFCDVSRVCHYRGTKFAYQASWLTKRVRDAGGSVILKRIFRR
ncbi:protein of unknown function [Candidatus Filomicrobium marinum]|uniref:Uncharacterized protein n=1 Tax=Candidatus Filomicrobium marinum TaxID=1608628 RepID=A0A0D6J9N8_9HYPH|nr:protein of unknown function [Candidatus Filomicrobium marinum]CPR14931.1 protein of unknown function [Candidatus Filomicrobium marinum]